MDKAEEKDTTFGPERYLKPGERLLQVSEHVRIKKFIFTAYITDSRVFLIDRNEKKPGVISKEIPRDVIISGILESPAEGDPLLVLSIRTTTEETRTMKIAFIEEGNDRTQEIEEWIAILQGRHVRAARSVPRHREPSVPVPKSETRTRPHEKHLYEAEQVHETVTAQSATSHQVQESLRKPDTPGEEVPGPADVQEQGHEAGDILFCHYCGRRIPQGANFCPYCGTKLHRSRTLPLTLMKKRENQEEY